MMVGGIFSLSIQRNFDCQIGAAISIETEANDATECAHAFSDFGQADARPLLPKARGVIEADAVVANGADNLSIDLAHAYFSAVCAGVLCRIGERFLRDSI